MNESGKQGERYKQWFMRDGRLRSGWRVVLFMVAAGLVWFLTQVLVLLLLHLYFANTLANQGLTPQEATAGVTAMMQNIDSLPLYQMGLRLSGMFAFLALIKLFCRLVDKRSFQSFGFQTTVGWWQELLVGIVFASVAWSVILFLALEFGAVTIVDSVRDNNNLLGITGSLALSLVTSMAIGIMEEASFRGYVLQNLVEGVRSLPAVVLSSALFSAAHIPSPGAGLASTLSIFFGGVMFAIGYYATHRLWFSIGLHAAWDFAQGPLLGFPVSGINMGGLVQTRVTGSEWLTDGKFGPSAAVLTMAVEIAIIAILFVWSRRSPINGLEASND